MLRCIQQFYHQILLHLTVRNIVFVCVRVSFSYGLLGTEVVCLPTTIHPRSRCSGATDRPLSEFKLRDALAATVRSLIIINLDTKFVQLFRFSDVAIQLEPSPDGVRNRLTTKIEWPHLKRKIVNRLMTRETKRFDEN
jgi:hypothetical protein